MDNLILQCGYSNPTQADMIQDLGLTISEVWIFAQKVFFF